MAQFRMTYTETDFGWIYFEAADKNEAEKIRLELISGEISIDDLPDGFKKNVGYESDIDYPEVVND